MENQCAHTGFGIHHPSLSQLNADLLWMQQLPDASLVFQVGTGGITEGVALAAITRSKALLHGHGGRIGESPIFADAAVEPFGATLCGFDRQGLQSVAV